MIKHYFIYAKPINNTDWENINWEYIGDIKAEGSDEALAAYKSKLDQYDFPYARDCKNCASCIRSNGK